MSKREKRDGSLGKDWEAAASVGKNVRSKNERYGRGGRHRSDDKGLKIESKLGT